MVKNFIRDYYNGLTLEVVDHSLLRCLCRIVALFFLVSSCFPATLSISNQTASQNQTVAIPITLATGGAAIAGVQFDLQWDQGLTIQVASGTTLGQAFKVLYSAPLSPRTLRCLIIGMNQTSLADGSLLELLISTDSSAAPGLAQVNLTNVIATNGLGDAVPLQAISGNVQILSGTTQTIPAESVVSGASMLSGPVAPGEIISLLGSFPLVPTVLFDGVRAPVIYAGIGQMNAVVPFGLDLNGHVDLQIRSQNQIVAEQSIPVAAIAPAIFTQSGTGTGPGTVQNEDYSLNTFATPAAPNSVLAVFGTGFGLMQAGVLDGQAVTEAIPLAIPVTATIGGIPADVTYAGSAPSLIAGVTQINVRVPGGLPSNLFTPIVLNIGTISTPLGVTVSIR